MLKLTRHLFQWEAAAEVADFYERAMLNHILSSQHPEDGRVIYNLSLEMGGYKSYQNPFWFTCCIGTGMENHSKYGWNVFFHSHEELFVCQFVASELNWMEKGVKIRQITEYPEEQGTTFEFESEKPVELTLQIRYPYWAERGMENGAAYCAAMGGVLQLTRVLDLEWAGHGITINAVGAGWFSETEQTGAAQEELLLKYIPLKRYGLPDEVGSLVVYLASDATDFFSGQFLHVDGAVMSHL